VSYILTFLLTPETKVAHRGAWFVWAGGQRMRHQATMRGTWGWDVECSCGEWASKTGGATRHSVESDFWDHRFSAQCAAARDGAPRG
jgi:hypothetical protein